MLSSILIFAACLYLLALLGTLIRMIKHSTIFQKYVRICERGAFSLFTGGLVYYAYALHQGLDPGFDRSLTWLTFAWAISFAHVLTDYLYINRGTALVANFWAALVILFLPSPQSFGDFFVNDLSWFNLYRTSFICAYAFCILGFSLAIGSFWKGIILARIFPEEGSVRIRQIQEMDRLQHKMVLWALPLLSFGLAFQFLALIDSDQLGGAFNIWGAMKIEILALASWAICALYLHARMYFRWSSQATTTMYFGGFTMMLAAQMLGVLA